MKNPYQKLDSETSFPSLDEHLLLEQKFGAVSEIHHQRVQAADGGELKRWLGRVLSASSAEAVFL